MSEQILFCPGCMNDVTGKDVCPYCGFDLKKQQESPFLPYQTVLGGKYIVGDILERNSEGVTYLGLDNMTNSCVRIREFLPSDLCDRNENGMLVPRENYDVTFTSYRRSFLDLWHKLAKLRHLDQFIGVRDVFESGGTAYAVCDADGTMTLGQYLDENGPMQWSDLSVKLSDLPGALEKLHANGIIHGGIAPDTLFLCADDRFRLWGFTIPELRAVDAPVAPEIRPGYAALEQYVSTEQLCPATDIYALSAVTYRSLTGKAPLDAQTRLSRDNLTIPAETAKALPEYVTAALIAGLQLKREDRPQNIQALRDALDPEQYQRARKAAAKPNATSNVLSNALLRDPLSDLEDGLLENEPKPRIPDEPVAIQEPELVPVLTKDAKPAGSSTATVVLISVAIVFIMLILFAALALTGLITFNFSGGKTTSARVFEMPDFGGRLKSDALIEQYANDYDLHITLQQENAKDVAPDVIFEQDIAPGTKVARGSNLTLKYSRGASTVSVPNFVGLPFTETVYYLGRLNLTYNIIERPNPGGNAAGTVAVMNPAAGSVVYEGTEIQIEIWGDASLGTVSGTESGSEITNSSSILSGIFGRLSEGVQGILGQ